MKLWQFISVCKDLKINNHILELNSESIDINSWYKNYDSIVDKQDRNILDFIIPDDICIKIFNFSKSYIYKNKNTYRRNPFSKNDKKIKIVDFFTQFGGEKLEQIFEYGSVDIS